MVAGARVRRVALIDIIVQVHAVRLLIAEHQLSQIRATVASSNEPVVIADPRRAACCSRTTRSRRCGARRAPRPQAPTPPSPPISRPASWRSCSSRPRPCAGCCAPWPTNGARGAASMALRLADGGTLPVAVRTEVVAARDGSVLGYFLIFVDLTDSRRVAEARRHLEQSLMQVIEDGPASRKRAPPSATSAAN